MSSLIDVHPDDLDAVAEALIEAARRRGCPTPSGPWAELPPEQRAKDHLFRTAVLGMARALDGCP